MNRVVWHCARCLDQRIPAAPFSYARLARREIGGAVRPCAVWRCPAGHEHFRVHERIGGSFQAAGGGPLWGGGPIRERLERAAPWELTAGQREREAAREKEREQRAREAWTGPPEAVWLAPVEVLPI